MSNPSFSDSPFASDPDSAVPADPWLDPVLSDELGEYVPDDGFVANVVSRLPARRRRRWMLRPILLAAGGVWGGAVGLLALSQGVRLTPSAAGFAHRVAEIASQALPGSALTAGQLCFLAICLTLIAGSIMQGFRLAHRG